MGVSALIRLVLLLLGVTLIAFLLVEASPLDPVAQYVANLRGVSSAQIENITALWGADLPWWERYASWLGGMLTGDFGYSASLRAPVAGILASAILGSLLLMAIAWVIAGVVGYGLGLVAGAYRGRFLDKVITFFCHLLNSTPPFVVGLVLLMIFGLALGWVPLGLSGPLGVMAADVTLAERLRHVALPALTVALVGVAPVILHTRAALFTVLDSETALFARARGYGTWQIVRRHGVRTTLLPAVMLQFANLSTLIAGATLAEVVFSYHGLGSVVAGAALTSDVPLLLGAVTIIAVVVFTGNLIADVIARRVDPRTRAVAA